MPLPCLSVCRVPFLDRHFLEYAMTLDPAAKMCGRNAIEKRVRQWKNIRYFFPNNDE